MSALETKVGRNAQVALGLLLGINLFNYIDRQVLAAVVPEIRQTFFNAHGDTANVRRVVRCAGRGLG